MTTEKLTARLSDGTEWEVLSTAGPTCGMRSGVPYRDETIRVELKPKKPSPPKEVWVNVYKDGGIGCAYTEKQNALNAGESRDAILNRYILAPEPEPKPAREWWVVVKKVTGVPHTTRNSEADAVSFVESFSVVEARQYEVVHVREVVSE